MQCGALQPSAELRFAAVVLTKHAKSAPAWAYRRWLLQQPQYSGDDAAIESELKLTHRLCDYYAKNYYAWTHRLWLAQRVATMEALEAEMQRTAEWQQTHISDHCGHHHQLQLMTLWAARHGWVELSAAVLQQTEMASVSEAAVDYAAVASRFAAAAKIALEWNARYPGHEALTSYLCSLAAYARVLRRRELPAESEEPLRTIIQVAAKLANHSGTAAQ